MMKAIKITDVFFDLDHTLWDFDKNSSLAFQRVFSTHKIEMEVAAFVKVYEPINFNYWKLFREEKVTKEELRRGRLTEAFEIFKMKFSMETIDALAVSYIAELPVDNHLFDGTVEILEYLTSKYKLHIITNGYEEVQHLKLKNSGIGGFFSTVTTSEEVGAKKPNPIIFTTALEKAGANPKHSLMVGDSFEADILGAAAVGMRTLFYNYRNETVPENHDSILSLADIKSFL